MHKRSTAQSSDSYETGLYHDSRTPIIVPLLDKLVKRFGDCFLHEGEKWSDVNAIVEGRDRCFVIVDGVH